MKDSKVIQELLNIEKQNNPFLNLLLKKAGWDQWRKIYKQSLKTKLTKED